MREIKFRAWDTDEQRWIEPKYATFATKNIPTRRYLALNQAGPYVVMQFTGLKDKNGVEIFEGDILHFTYWWFDGNQAETSLVGEVVYIPEQASYGLAHIRNKEWLRHIGAKDGDEDTQSFSGWQFTCDDIEVIGNIYENPELLK